MFNHFISESKLCLNVVIVTSYLTCLTTDFRMNEHQQNYERFGY